MRDGGRYGRCGDGPVLKVQASRPLRSPCCGSLHAHKQGHNASKRGVVRQPREHYHQANACAVAPSSLPPHLHALEALAPPGGVPRARRLQAVHERAVHHVVPPPLVVGAGKRKAGGRCAGRGHDGCGLDAVAGCCVGVFSSWRGELVFCAVVVGAQGAVCLGARALGAGGGAAAAQRRRERQAPAALQQRNAASAQPEGRQAQRHGRRLQRGASRQGRLQDVERRATALAAAAARHQTVAGSAEPPPCVLDILYLSSRVRQRAGRSGRRSRVGRWAAPKALWCLAV